MTKINSFLSCSLVAMGLAVSFSSAAAPFSANVTNDAYSNAVNGIATANYNNDDAPDLYEIANKLLGTTYTGNEGLDARLINPADELFEGNGKHSVMLAGMAADNKNTLGYYSDIGVGSTRTELISEKTGYFTVGADGSAGNPFDASVFDVEGQFGFYLESKQYYEPKPTLDFFSEAALNTIDGGLDHMMTFSLDELNGQTYWIDDGSGPTEYTYENAMLIGWEDMLCTVGSHGCDDDYDDMIYVVDFKNVDVDVPAPGTLTLFGLMLMLPFLRRRNK